MTSTTISIVHSTDTNIRDILHAAQNSGLLISCLSLHKNNRFVTGQNDVNVCDLFVTKDHYYTLVRCSVSAIGHLSSVHIMSIFSTHCSRSVSQSCAMANIRTLTLTVFHVIFVDSCVHDQQQFLKPVRGHQQYMERRASGYMPIRIVFDTRYIDNTSVAPATQQYIHSLLSYAQNRFRTVLSVQPVVGNLFVSRNCSLYWLQGSVLGNCSVASDINQCGQVREIPAEHLGGLLVVPATGVLNYIAPGTGIPNADLIVYVTLSAGNICGGSTLAYASACQVDQNDRPIVGNINFCPFNATRSADPFQRLHDQETALHELIHVLGFSSPLFALFRDASGSPRTPRCPSAPGCTDADAPGDPPFNASSGSFAVSPSTVLASTRRGAGRSTRRLNGPAHATPASARGASEGCGVRASRQGHGRAG